MKKFITLLMVALLVVSTLPVSAKISCEQVYYPIYFNGVLAPDDGKPILSLNWNTYVPLRKVCEGSGLDVVWNEEKQEIHVQNTGVLAAQDYSNLSQIYGMFDKIWLYAGDFSESFYDSINAFDSSDAETLDAVLESVKLNLESIDNDLDTIKLYINKLYGYYDNNTVTKETYTAIEDILKNCLILYLTCYDSYDALLQYIKGNMTLKGLLEYAQQLNDTRKHMLNSYTEHPRLISQEIAQKVGYYATYYYFDYQSINPSA